MFLFKNEVVSALKRNNGLTEDAGGGGKRPSTVRYICPVCEKPIAGDLGVVRRHLVAFHGGKRHNAAERLTAEEHECQVCQKVFFVRERRDEHLKNEHFRYSSKYRVMK